MEKYCFLTIIAILCLNIGLTSAGQCPVPSLGYSRARMYASTAGCNTVHPFHLPTMAYHPVLSVFYRLLFRSTCAPNWNYCANCEFWKLRSCDIYAKCLCCCSWICGWQCEQTGAGVQTSLYNYQP